MGTLTGSSRAIKSTSAVTQSKSKVYFAISLASYQNQSRPTHRSDNAMLQVRWTEKNTK